MSFISTDVVGINHFASSVGSAARRLPPETKRAETQSAEAVASTARGIAGRYSQKVAASIRTAPTSSGVQVRAGGDALPIAGLWEYGNKGSGDSPTFTHPVYGNRNVTVEQARHPFMDPAIRENESMMTRYANSAVDRAFSPYGLRPSGI